ncbi:MAG: hypothetical protein ACJ76I_13150 [Gaiellaceae bacterium]
MPSESNGNGSLTRRLAHKALMPIVATAASAAAGYAAKKGPDVFEQRLLPRLKKIAGGAGDVKAEIPERAKSVAGGAGELAEGLAQRAKDVVPHWSGGGHDGDLSPDELERHITQRAEARAARRKTTTKR